MKKARFDYHRIQKRTPRRIPYIRSKYFVKDKIFINTFWDHLNSKSPADRVRRLKLYGCAIELTRNSAYAPESTQDPNNSDEMLHRFYGSTDGGLNFYVQIKENKKSGRKDLMSVFPEK